MTEHTDIEQVTIYLPAHEKQNLREEAAREGLTISRYIRRLLEERKRDV